MAKQTKKPAQRKPRGLTTNTAGFRWVPEPSRLRPDGWKQVTFKHPDGRYFTYGESHDAAEAINLMVDDWYMRGIAPSGPWAHLAPAGIATRRAPPVAAGDSIGQLIDDWKATRKFQELAPRTQADYANRIHRLVETFAGFAVPPHRKDLPPDVMAAEIERYEATMARVRAASVRELLPVDGEEVPPLQQVYYDQVDAGAELGRTMLHNAKAVIVTAHIWLEYVVKKRHKLPFNPAGAVDCRTPPGRVVVWADDEYQAVLDAAVAHGWHSIAFACQLSRELSWSRGDVLAMRLSQFHEDVKYEKGQLPRRVVRVEGARAKTDIRTFTTLTDDGLALYDQIRAWHTQRLGGGNVSLLPSQRVLVVDDNAVTRTAAGSPWSEDYFAHRFRELCNVAGAALGRPIDKRFADLRDTAITEQNEAGLDKHEKQSRRQHALTSIDAMDQKHYGATTLNMSDSAADKLNALRANRRARQSEVEPKKGGK